jgi:hypothetical protein
MWKEEPRPRQKHRYKRFIVISDINESEVYWKCLSTVQIAKHDK